MPKAVDNCVQKLLDSEDFQAPKGYDGDRESFAWALCNTRYKEGLLGESVVYVNIDGATYYSEDKVQWFKAAINIEEPSEEEIGQMVEAANKYMGALTPGSIIKFSDAVLVRAEVNKNRDEIDGQGIQEIASSLPLKPIDHRHDRQKIVGIFIDAEAKDGAVPTKGLIWAGRYPEVAFDLVAGKGNLSIDARAERAVCRECGGVFVSEKEYCGHINRNVGGQAVRKLEGLVADGGSIVPNPAGSDTGIPPQSLRMIAHIPVEGCAAVQASTEDIVEEETIDLMCEFDEGAFLGKQLTYKEREDLEDSDFALIQKKDGKKIRRFPIYDCAHARNALARLPNAKGLSSEERASIERKAQAKINSKECQAELKGGTSMEDELKQELADAKAQVTAKTEELEASLTRISELETKVAELESAVQATEGERDSIKEERDTLEKERGELQGQMDEMKLNARLEKVQPFMVAEELEERKEEIANMTDGAFNIVVAALETASKRQTKPGPVLLGDTPPEEEPEEIVWAK